jgi:hypothetical protein
VTLPGDGRDRVFKVSIKWQAQISLFHLEDALEGRSQNMPFDAKKLTHFIQYKCLNLNQQIFTNKTTLINKKCFMFRPYRSLKCVIHTVYRAHSKGKLFRFKKTRKISY